MDLISVVVPIYNVERYLDTCIKSIISQSYNNIEIILVDDGSKDNCSKICDDFKQQDSRIKVIHKSNGGLSDARNAGMKKATGEYIMFIDSDDYIFPGYIEYLYDLIKTNNADISVCQVVEIDENGEIIEEKGIPDTKIVEGTYNCIREFTENTSIDTPAWRKLYRKSLFSNNCIQYPVGRLHEDVFTTHKLILHSNRIAIGSKALYGYRIRAGSIVNSSFTTRHMDYLYGSIERYKDITNIFPQLDKHASKGIIHAANMSLLRIGRSQESLKYFRQDLKNAYSKYLWKYLLSNAKILSKCFAILAFVNIDLTLKLIRLKNKNKI